MPTDVSPYPMLEIAHGLSIILQQARALPTETVPRAQALGRVAATDIVSTVDAPPFDASTVDGYAVRSVDGGAPRTLTQEIFAGSGGRSVGLGEAARITTGAPIPPGADAVVMLEYAGVAGSSLVVEGLPNPGDNVRRAGSDLAVGDVAIAAGARIGPAEIGVLATLGLHAVPVHRLPRVAVLSTGDEVRDADSAISGAEIRDSNGPALVAAIQAAGFHAKFLGIVPDIEAEQERRLRAASAGYDVVLTNGGVSVGARDLIKPILARIATVGFGRLDFKPGKPLSFAYGNGTLFFGLPGNPVSAMVCLALFVQPALRALAGEVNPRPAYAPAIAGHRFRCSDDRPEYQRALVRWENGQLIARTTGSQASSRLASLVGANALVALPKGGGWIDAGGALRVVLTGAVESDDRL